MSYSKKLGSFMLTILCFPFSFLFWYLCFAFTALFGAGYFAFVDFVEVFQDGRSSYFLRRNPKYGSYEYYSYTDKIKNNIYDDEGNIVGSYETDGATHSGWDKDENLYAPRHLLCFFYMLIFPIHKVLALIASFLSLFTGRFYVSVKAPEDYNDIKYYRALHCFFNVVAERREDKQNQMIKRQKEKQRKKDNILNAKKEKQVANEELKKEKLKTADKYLGVLIKVLGVMGVAVALFFIFK